MLKHYCCFPIFILAICLTSIDANAQGSTFDDEDSPSTDCLSGNTMQDPNPLNTDRGFGSLLNGAEAALIGDEIWLGGYLPGEEWSPTPELILLYYFNISIDDLFNFDDGESLGSGGNGG